jgi:hypothetical protein
MKRARTLTLIAAAAAIGATALPSQAAASRTLYFDDQYSKGTGTTCTPHWVLSKNFPGDGNCNSIQFGVAGNGNLADNDYAGLSSSLGGKLDAKRALTGHVYIAEMPIVGGVGINYMPGNVGATITITINGVSVGSVSKSGPVQPNQVLDIPINMALPKSLNGKKLTSVDADVAYTDGVWTVGVVYASPYQSKLVVPTK